MPVERLNSSLYSFRCYSIFLFVLLPSTFLFVSFAKFVPEKFQLRRWLRREQNVPHLTPRYPFKIYKIQYHCRSGVTIDRRTEKGNERLKKTCDVSSRSSRCNLGLWTQIGIKTVSGGDNVFDSGTEDLGQPRTVSGLRTKRPWKRRNKNEAPENMLGTPSEPWSCSSFFFFFFFFPCGFYGFR